MVALKRALQGYVDEVFAGGSPRSEALFVQLHAIQRRNAGYFKLAVIMLVLISLSITAILASDAIHQTAVPVGAALVVSGVGTVRVLFGLWREKVATEMLIAMSELDESVLKQVAAALLRRLR